MIKPVKTRIIIMKTLSSHLVKVNLRDLGTYQLDGSDYFLFKTPAECSEVQNEFCLNTWITIILNVWGISKPLLGWLVKVTTCV